MRPDFVVHVLKVRKLLASLDINLYLTLQMAMLASQNRFREMLKRFHYARSGDACNRFLRNTHEGVYL